MPRRSAGLFRPDTRYQLHQGRRATVLARTLPVCDSFTGTNGDPPDPARWSRLVTGTTAIDIQSNQLSLRGDASGNTGHVRLTIGPTGDQEFLGIVEAGADNAWLWLMLRASGFGGGLPDGGYFLEFTDTGDVPFLYRRASASNTFISASPGGGPLANGERRWVHFQAFGTALRVQQWPVGTAPPAGWALDTTDATIASGVPAAAIGASGTYLLDDVCYDAVQQARPPAGLARVPALTSQYGGYY